MLLKIYSNFILKKYIIIYILFLNRYAYRPEKPEYVPSFKRIIVAAVNHAFRVSSHLYIDYIYIFMPPS